MAEIELLATVPVFSVADIAKSLVFYRDKLGFSTTFELGPYAGLERGPLTLHPDGNTGEFSARPTSCRYHVRNVDALCETLEPHGVVKPDEQLETQPHGMRQFSVLDIDGNRITFAEPVAT